MSLDRNWKDHCLSST